MEPTKKSNICIDYLLFQQGRNKFISALHKHTHTHTHTHTYIYIYIY